MLVSMKHKFIFIHTYKTGGTSIQNYLLNHNIGERDKFGDIPLHYHAKASEVRDIMGAHLFSSLFSFAFVRNPWDLEYSLYKFVLRDSELLQHYEAKKCQGFKRYLMLRYYKFLEDMKNNPDNKQTYCRQIPFVCDSDGSQLVNFVGRFERLAEDFGQALQKIGVELEEPLPHENKSTEGDFRNHYTTRMVDYVAEMFRRDIEFFNYTFE